MSEVKDKLVTAESLKNAYDDNKNRINELKGDLVNQYKITNTNNILPNPLFLNCSLGRASVNNGGYTVKLPLSSGIGYGVFMPKAVGSTPSKLTYYLPLDSLDVGKTYRASCSKTTKVNGRFRIFGADTNGVAKTTILNSSTTTNDYDVTFTITSAMITSEVKLIYVEITNTDNKDSIYYYPMITEDSGSVENIFGDTFLNSFKMNLIGKTLYVDGDSISYGAGNNGYSYADILRDEYGMIVDKYAVSGGTMASGTQTSGGADRHWVCDSVVSNFNKSYDYAIISGGFNDLSVGVSIGSMTDDVDNPLSTTVDNTTFVGALETIFRHIQCNYPTTKIFFLVTHKIANTWIKNRGGDRNFTDFYNAIVSVCNRYAVEIIDVFNESGLNTAYDSMLQFTGSNDGVHPTLQGYELFYMPIIKKHLLN